MKIKTIFQPMNTLENAKIFDQQVNDLVAGGWQLTKREVLPGQKYNETNWAKRVLYAELTQQDEPEAPDPWDALRAIKALCLATPTEECERENCPIYGFCTKQFKELPEGWDV